MLEAFCLQLLFVINIGPDRKYFQFVTDLLQLPDSDPEDVHGSFPLDHGANGLAGVE